jgi:uncharacterized protein GlcG (DUF336 family)
MSQDPVMIASVGVDLAMDLLAGVRTEAATRGVAMGAAVVDVGGNVVASCRMDGAQLVALPLAVDKAWTAAACGQPTERWASSSVPGEGDWGLSTALGGRFIVFAGGLPIVTKDGVLIGGLGVSGSAAEIDRACAEAALRSAGLPV